MTTSTTPPAATPSSESPSSHSFEVQAARSTELLALLSAKLGSQILSSSVELGDAVIRINSSGARDFFKLLKLDAELQFNALIDITAVDFMDSAPERFEVVYHLLSIPRLHRLRIKITVSESAAKVESLTPLWKGATFLEREVWDMYGISFTGHPDLRRIMMYAEFEGHPLRKDFPVQGKQPRIPLRSPEVRNTALDMTRPTLVKINPRKGAA